MAGTETARFDFVMQFSEDAYQEVLGIFFDTGGLIPRIVDLIPGLDGSEFTLDVSLDRPTDVPLSGSGENPIDIRLGLGDGGSVATLRMVAGITVDRSAPDRDRVQIDFEHSIYFAQVTMGGMVVPIPNLVSRLEALLPPLPVLPVPVNRTSTDATQLTRVDFRIIDDTTGADRDATAAMLTFGGGATGGAASLQSFVPDGGRGAIGIFFRWLCRMAAPRMEESLGVPSGSFTLSDDRCDLNTTVPIGDDGAELASLSLSLADGFITVAARVTKSGFCYDASGDVSARIRLEIVDGRLVASAEIGDPDVGVDIPWYCWLAAGVIGAVVGGVLLGVIGAIVGAILIPLILWLSVNVVESTIDRVIDEIRDAINAAIPDVDVPAFFINIVFQRVFIDDVVIQTSFDVKDPAPVRAQGLVLLRPGQGLDLDTGSVGDAALAVTDVSWQGRDRSRRLQTGCQASLARTTTNDFAGLARYTLYGCAYQLNAVVPLDELGVENPLATLPFPFELTNDDVFESRRVYGMKTNEGRYAAIQAVEIQDDYVRLRYKTFETNVVAVSIVGDFTCQKAGSRPGKDAVVRFEPELPVAVGIAVAGASVSSGSAGPTVAGNRPRPTRMTAGGDFSKPAAEPCDPPGGATTGDRGGTSGGKRPFATGDCRQVSVPPFHEGRWVIEHDVPQTAKARLEAVATGTKGKDYLWAVGAQAVEGDGSFDVGGTKVTYHVSGKYLLLEVAAGKAIELFVRVTVVDAGGCSATAARCVHHSGKCRVKQRHTPTFAQVADLAALPAIVVQGGGVTVQEGLVQPRPDGTTTMA